MRKIIISLLVVASMLLAGSGIGSAAKPGITEKPNGVTVIADTALASANTPASAVNYALSQVR